MEVAELRNGFTIRHRSREMRDGSVRLYMDEAKKSFVDIPAEEIQSYSTASRIAEPAAGSSRRIIAGDACRPSTPAKSTGQIVREASEKHGVDSDFIRSVIRAGERRQRPCGFPCGRTRADAVDAGNGRASWE